MKKRNTRYELSELLASFIEFIFVILALYFLLQEFVKAVDAWRSRDPNAPPGKGGSSASTVSQAEKLGRELEQEREAMALKIRKQKEEAERRLQEVRYAYNKNA